METTPTASKRVGGRELGQNLSVYLERVAAGTVSQVTDRGRAVGRLRTAVPGGAYRG